MLQQELVDFRGTMTGLAYHPQYAERFSYWEAKQLGPTLQNFSAFLGKKNFLMGDEVCLADFVCYEIFDQCKLMSPKSFESHANLQAYLKRFEALPAIAAFMKSDKYFARPCNNKSATFK